MFDIGFFELLVIGVVLLVVMGPDRLPEVARQAAFVIKRVRTWVFQMKSEMNLIDDPMFEEFKKTKQELNDFQRDLKQVGTDLTKGLNEDVDIDDTLDSNIDGLDIDEDGLFDDSFEIPEDVEEPTKKVAKKKSSKKVAKKVSKKTATKKKVTKKTPSKVAKKTSKKSSKKVTKRATKKKPS